MGSYTDKIKPSDYGIHTYLENLMKKNYQIPTFQREVVWDRNQVKGLWDSIYKFYPLGSILVWKTDIKLQNHRSIGGHIIAEEDNRTEFQYILDGQQRTTSLLTSLYGGKIEGKGNFDPTLYFDLTVEDKDEVDDDSYKKRFLFWDEIDDRGGTFKPNMGKMKRYGEGLIVKLQDIRQNFGRIERKLQEGTYSDYDHPIRARLRQIRDVLDNYRISFIELKGIQVSQVCQIFERINQAGQPLNIFDIVVAKTFRTETEDKSGFYLREIIEDFRKDTEGNYKDLDDLTYLQILAVLINQNIDGSKIYNITDRYLNDIRAEQIEAVWPYAKETLLKLFDFFENHLHLKGPKLIPYRYFYMALSSYFYNHSNPNYNFLKKYFWYHSFHNEDLLSNTTQLWQHVDFLRREKNGANPAFERFLIDKNRLRTSSYSSRGRLSRAILSLLANQEPRDWAYTDRHVLLDVYYILTDKPNLHHIFPSNYISQNKGKNTLDSNSLMNIAYLTQITNLQISDDNPIQYLMKFDSHGFEEILSAHLIPKDVLDWARMQRMPENSLDIFIEKRIEFFIGKIKEKLTGINVDIIDTKESSSEELHAS